MPTNRTEKPRLVKEVGQVAPNMVLELRFRYLGSVGVARHSDRVLKFLVTSYSIRPISREMGE